MPICQYQRRRLTIDSFYNAHSVYDDFGGSALAPQEGINIANALGNNKAVILQNHGILAVGKTVDGATFNFGALDRCIEAQLMADAAGKNRGWETIKVDHKEAEYTRRVYNDELEYVTFQPAYVESPNPSPTTWKLTFV